MARATLIGFSAVAMWALLALLTDASGKTPPFLLSAITFAIGTMVGLVARLFMPAPERPAKIPFQVWVVGIGGLFGYHFFYFTALRNAPAVEASLIAYLWPLLIVSDKDLETVVVGMTKMIGSGDQQNEWNVIMATAVLAMLPPVAVVILMHRWFVKGLTETEK